MTREEAIKRLEANRGAFVFKETNEALDMAIEALSTERLYTHEEVWADDDIISREDAMGAVQDHFNDDGFKGYDDGQKMLNRINALPSADRPIVIKSNIALSKEDYNKWAEEIKRQGDNIIVISYEAECISADRPSGEWIPLIHDTYMTTNFPHERDGQWVIVTDGKSISVERIKKDAYDHFFPNGRWFELEHTTAWMPLPKPYGIMKGGNE